MDTVSVCSERPPSVTIYPAVPVVTNSPTAANATTNVAASSAPSPTSSNLAGLVRPVPGSIPRRCPLCPSHHALYRCPTFRAMSFERRMRTVVSLGHCVNCLMMGHHARTCQSASRCAQCQQKHHSTLHSRVRRNHRQHQSRRNVAQTTVASRNLVPVSTPRHPSISPVVASAAALPISRVVALSPTLVVRVILPQATIPVRALLDPCCRISHVCESLVRSFRLPITFLNEEVYCDLAIGSRFDENVIKYITPRVAKLERGKTPTVSVSSALRESFAGLELADPTFFQSGAIALVLGPEVYAQIVSSRVLSQPGLPTAQYTVFGWIISGTTSR